MYEFLALTLRSKLDAPVRKASVESIMTGVISQAVLVISGVLVARALGPEGRGYLALLVVFPAILSQLGSFGLPQAATYYIAMNHDDARVIYNRLKVPTVVQVLVLFIIHLIIVSFYVRQQPEEVIIAGYLSLAVIPGMIAQQYGLAILQGCQMYRPFNVMRLMPATMYAVLILSIFLAQVASLPSIAFVWVLSYVMVGIITAYYAKIRVLRLAENKDDKRSPTLPQMFKFGLRGLLGTVSPMQNFRLDQLVAGLFLSPAALGLYVVGQAFTNLVRFIAQSAGMVAYPAVAANESNATAKQLIRRFFVSVAVMNGLVVLALIAVIPVLVPFFFGKAFSGSIPIARLLLLGAYFESLRRILVEGMRGMGKPEISTWAELSMYPLFAIAAPILIGFYDLIGLAETVILCYFLSLIVSLVFFRFSKIS